MTNDLAEQNSSVRWGRRLKWSAALSILCLVISMAYVIIQTPPNWQRGLIAVLNVALLLAAGWSMMRLMEVKRSGTSATSRYLKRMMVVTVIYVGGVFFAEALFDRFDLQGVSAFAVALVPALGVLGFIWTMGRYLMEEQDEYIRMRETQKFMIATAFMMVIITIYGFFEQFELVPNIPAYFAFVVWCFGLGVGSLIQWRRG